MIYVGVDPSLTSPGLAILETDGSLRGAFSLATKQLRGGDRLAAIYSWAEELLPEKPAVAVIEGYALAAQNRPFDLGEAGGVLRLALARLSIPYTVVPPAQVKQFVTGNGQATKAQVQAGIKHNWGLSFVQEDEADAYAMARLAQALGSTLALPAYQEAVVAKIRGANRKFRITPRKTGLNV